MKEKKKSWKTIKYRARWNRRHWDKWSSLRNCYTKARKADDREFCDFCTFPTTIQNLPLYGIVLQVSIDVHVRVTVLNRIRVRSEIERNMQKVAAETARTFAATDILMLWQPAGQREDLQIERQR